MKKRLFITTALMTAVLGCSLATGTYAWYEAGAGKHGEVSANQSLTTKTENLSDFAITTTWAFGLEGSTSTTETPATSLALTANDGNAYVINSAGFIVQAGSTSKYYKVKVTLSAKADDLIAHQGEEYKITVTGTNRARVAPLANDWFTKGDCVDSFKITKPSETGSTMVDFKSYEFYVSMMGNNDDSAITPNTQVKAESTGVTGNVNFSLAYVEPTPQIQ